MKRFSRSLFIYLLFAVGIATVASLSVKGWDYYTTPLELRPFRSGYSSMKPSGIFSHGLGIAGSLMIMIGVVMYSTRKRVRSMRNMGKLSHWLEVHIFLCLLGPTLVVYHTTFKAGGIAAITLFTMLSVAASGVVGRFLYGLIPRNLNGDQFTLDEINRKIHELGLSLQSVSSGTIVMAMMDASFASVRSPKTLGQTIASIITLQRTKSQTKHAIHKIVSRIDLSHDLARRLREAATTRAGLLQKSMVLSQVEKLFFYWHAIHLPFTIIMFITLALHVVVVILLGYRWIF